MALGPAAEPRANYRPPRQGNGSAAVLRPDMVATSPVIGGVANVVMEIVIVTALLLPGADEVGRPGAWLQLPTG